MWRRVIRLSEYCKDYEVAGFVRKNVPLDHSHEFTSLGTIEHGRFFGRIPVYISAFRKSIPRIKKSEVCYVFSLDILAWVYLIKLLTGCRPKLVYEVADVHPMLTSRSILGRCVRGIERFLVKRSRVTVFTSENFYSGYFCKVQKFRDFKYVTIENKVQLPRSVREEIVFRPMKPGRLSIGYFGLLKSPKSFEVLLDLAKRLEGFLTVRFAGRFVYPNDIDACLAAIEGAPNMKYLGPYRSPEDLSELYGNVDLVWDAYYEGDNSTWQRTTRFSESCFFRSPLIYNSETQDGKLAAEYNLGIPMEFDDIEGLAERLCKVDNAWIRQKFERFDALPDELVYYGSEYESLVEAIES